MSKETVESTKRISINWMMKNGNYSQGKLYLNQSITWTTTGVWRETKNSIAYTFDLANKHTSGIRLYYAITNNGTNKKEDVDYIVNLDTTSCFFGGFRYWFTCPGVNCGRRVESLYLGQKYFLCRHCLSLSYESRNCSKRFRSFSKIFEYENRIEKLANNIWCKYGRTLYRRKPTNKYRKYMNLSSLENKHLKSVMTSLTTRF